MKEPLRSVALPGVHAYAEKVVAAGSDIHFRISGSIAKPFTLSIRRPELTWNGYGDQPDQTLVSAGLIKEIPPIHGSFVSQSVTPGSFVLVDDGLPADMALNALTLECWVRPSQFNGPKNAHPEVWWGLISQYSYKTKCGFGLFLTSWGTVGLYLGDGKDYEESRLVVWSNALTEPFKWVHVVGVWDGQTASLWIDGQRLKPTPISGPVSPGNAPLRLAAYGEDGKTSHFLDGDLAMPTIYGRALSEQEIKKRYEDRARQQPSPTDVLACWPLTEEKGPTVADIGPHKLTGTLINRGTWMIGGPSFDADSVPRFGNYDPTKDLLRGHALRFASDDLFDAGWGPSPDCTRSLPRDLKPGIYIGRIEYETPVKNYDVTFVVTKPQSQPKAKMAVLCATNTWLAYNCTPFVPNYEEEAPPVWGNDGRYDKSAPLPTAPPQYTPAYNYYHDHGFGQPTYLLGMNLPWPGACPDVRYFGNDHQNDYSHLVRAELFTHYWLDKNGYDYDVLTDFDLNKRSDALTDYEVLLIAGHSEYWTTQAYEAVEAFLEAEHDVIVLSGNTMFWRVSFDPGFEVMECRKAQYLPGGRFFASTGETWHSSDGKRGGLMRECGYPTWRVLGMESVGFWNDTVMGDYTCDAPNHELFQSPNKVEIEDGLLAESAVGHEWDVRVTLSQQSDTSYIGMQRYLQDLSKPGTIPAPSAVTPYQPDPQPDRIQLLGHCMAYRADRDRSSLRGDGLGSNTIWDYFIREVDPTNSNNSEPLYNSLCNSEVIYWERTQGGRVFFAGANATGQALWGGKSRGSTNTAWQNLLRNVLAKFGVPPSRTPMS
jgi:hypothetical protein